MVRFQRRFRVRVWFMIRERVRVRAIARVGVRVMKLGCDFLNYKNRLSHLHFSIVKAGTELRGAILWRSDIPSPFQLICQPSSLNATYQSPWLLEENKKPCRN